MASKKKTKDPMKELQGVIAKEKERLEAELALATKADDLSRAAAAQSGPAEPWARKKIRMS